MIREKRQIIEDKALSLLLKQDLKGEYALAFFDFRKILTSGKVNFDTISSYENSAGNILSRRPEGMTVKSGSRYIILYDDKIKNLARINFTVCHELGHIYLDHLDDGIKSQREANYFAASLLMPEAVVRFLDCRNGERLTPEQMTNYFCASLSACKKRRAELDTLDGYFPSKDGAELVKRLFEH